MENEHIRKLGRTLNKGLPPPGTASIEIDHVDFEGGTGQRVRFHLEPRAYGLYIRVADTDGKVLGEVLIENYRIPRHESEGQVRVHVWRDSLEMPEQSTIIKR